MARDRPVKPGPVSVQGALDALHGALERVLEGSGHMVLVHGPEGSNRGELLWRFTTEARKRHRRLRLAMGDAADPEAPAWRQIALQLTATRRAGRALLRTLPEWLSFLPLIGPVLEATIETVRKVRKRSRGPVREEVLGTGSGLDQVRALLSEAPRQPRLIVVQNLDGGDAAELAGAFGLVQRLAATRTLFVCTSASAAGRTAGVVTDILREAERLGRGSVIELAPAAASAPGLAPGTVGPEELATFTAEEIALLRAAGQLGATFHASVLQGRLELDELVLQDRLARLQRRGVIAFIATVEEGPDFTDRYGFRNAGDAARWAALPDARTDTHDPLPGGADASRSGR